MTRDPDEDLDETVDDYDPEEDGELKEEYDPEEDDE